MKKNLSLILTACLLWGYTPSFAIDDSSYMSIDEYSRFFELGLLDEENKEEENTQDAKETFKPQLKEKIDLDGDDVIGIELGEPLKINIEKTGFFDTYKEEYKEEDAKNSLFETEKFSIFSDSSKELSSYMTNNLKSTFNAKYDFNDNLSLKAGHEAWYVNPDATIGSKKFYINPRINLTERFYLDYTGRFNQTTENIEQEVGVKYRPRIFKDTAEFGVQATTIMNNDNQVQSKRLKFTTDLYIY